MIESLEEFTTVCRNDEHVTNEDLSNTAIFRSVCANDSDDQSEYELQHTGESNDEMLSYSDYF